MVATTTKKGPAAALGDIPMYRLIKTTNNNVIIRRDETNKIALLVGRTNKVLGDRGIDNHGYCLKLSFEMKATKYVAGSFQRAVEQARQLIMES